MINPLDNMDFEKRNFVSNSKYIKNDDIFISLNNGIRYLTQEDFNKISLVLIDSKNEQKDHPKILKKNNQQIDQTAINNQQQINPKSLKHN